MRTAALFFLLVALAAPSAAEDSPPIVLYRIMGNFPMELEAGDKVGIMLINDGDKKSPSPHFIVAIAESRTVVDTKDLKLFRSVLSRLPKGSEVTEYDSCTVPRSWGLKEEHYTAFYTIFDDLGLKIAEETRTICTCNATSRPVSPIGGGKAAPAAEEKAE